MENSNWRGVPGHQNYEVSVMGLVRNIGSGHILKPWIMPNGYYAVYLGSANAKTVHSVVMLAFCGPRPPGAHINHKNGVKADNRFPNLEYTTQQENERHKHRVLGIQTGVTHYKAMFVEEQIRAMRQLRSEGFTYDAIGARFGTGRSHTRQICLRLRYANVK